MRAIDHSTFGAEIAAAGSRLSPFRAGLLLARECAYPELRPSDYVNQLDDLTIAAQRRLAAQAGNLERGLALAVFLFQDQGFRGNAGDYSDPRNSYLNEVLERRLGIPITLSVIFLEAAQRLRISAAGVGLPGHFIVSVKGEDGPVYLDPFNGGRRLAFADCYQLVKTATGTGDVFDMQWLEPTPAHAIVARMLNNLRNFYVSVDDWPTAVKIVERLRILQPGTHTHLRDLGVLSYRNGAYRRAYELLNEYLTRSPNAPDAATVRQSRDLLMQELARLN